MTEGPMPEYPVPSLTRKAFTVTSVVIVTVLLVLWRAMEVLVPMFVAVLIAVLLRFMRGFINPNTPLNAMWALSLVLALSAAAIWIALREGARSTQPTSGMDAEMSLTDRY